MATIKELLQSFCYRINQPAPTAFVGITSPAERQYLELLRSVGDNLRNRPYQWPALKRGYSFTTVSGQAKYQLPGDFYRILDSTEWDVTNQWPLVPASDAKIKERQVGAISLQTAKVFRLTGPTQHLYSTSPYSQRSSGVIEFDPIPDNSSDELYLGYLSANWIWPRDWAATTVYIAGDIRSVNGYVYICKTGGTSSSARPTTSTANTDITDGTVTWRVYTEPYPCSSANAALHDDDVCLFDEDLMIQGILWAYLQAKGQDFQGHRVDWEGQVKSAYARFVGPKRLNLADESGGEDEWPITPAGSWSY